MKRSTWAVVFVLAGIGLLISAFGLIFIVKPVTSQEGLSTGAGIFVGTLGVLSSITGILRYLREEARVEKKHPSKRITQDVIVRGQGSKGEQIIQSNDESESVTQRAQAIDGGTLTNVSQEARKNG